MLAPDDLYYVDKRLVPGQTTRDDVLDLLGGTDASGLTQWPLTKRFAVWYTPKPGFIVSTPVLTAMFYFAEETLASAWITVPKPAESTFEQLCRSQFGKQFEIVRLGTRDEATRWHNNQSEALLQRGAKTRCGLTIAHLESMKSFQKEHLAWRTSRGELPAIPQRRRVRKEA
ncbi:hypothetical protein [Planctomyces sp. SH-PL14]|uniref:hypothetical protein n=1 Tax=Planctomyces sp. SH-PL14 TaxID=1632864 RepID=UPI00078C12F6|nr:hypothetical protein [Planctomyces sp. SH-PL14]AMV16941.1 hypothetical protein VT03_03565 [Planctomyces sp. SH-PL14]